ncbi:peptidase [Cryptococcus neoformans]|nr:peptidase [Cryptococcus neoformans var. grubii AD1-83a]OXG50740.1 peptidase [Cryptococcus neoformans var. grubii Th84]OXG59912.1 peptidase [Cryptococcus neoformans var. grubii MW-RSA1955]OXG63820.1 peptidase [Cryptococcus neoformans var. grubii c8]OXG64872.1 peptidase [Cryptococcus neoformans var. grubii CHC193]OXH11173.1 peptidase [Cryptococcus neoformans var. grubii A5-35-17]OXH11229.1 peptidase [Cryptococcus neoformans var. grubii]OXH12541.1 peptidase [Cryptococcus neoformans var. grub
MEQLEVHDDSFAAYHIPRIPTPSASSSSTVSSTRAQKGKGKQRAASSEVEEETHVATPEEEARGSSGRKRMAGQNRQEANMTRARARVSNVVNGYSPYGASQRKGAASGRPSLAKAVPQSEFYSNPRASGARQLNTPTQQNARASTPNTRSLSRNQLLANARGTHSAGLHGDSDDAEGSPVRRAYKPDEAEDDVPVLVESPNKEPSSAQPTRRTGGEQGTNSNPFKGKGKAADVFGNHRDARHPQPSRATEDDDEVEYMPPKEAKNTKEMRVAELDMLTKQVTPRFGQRQRRPMNNKDGNQVKTSNRTPTKVLKSPGDSVPLIFNVAWISPNTILRCTGITFDGKELRLACEGGGSSWKIDFKKMINIQLCTSHEHPFICFEVNPSDTDFVPLNNLLDGKRLNYEDTVQLCIKPSKSWQTAQRLDTFLSRLRSQGVGRVDELDQASCKLLSESCNSQVLDTRARHEAQRRAKAAEAAEKRIASRASSPIDSWPYGTDDKKEEKEKKPATKGGRGKKKEDQEDRNQSKLNFAPQPVVPVRRSSRRSTNKLVEEISSDDERPVHVSKEPPPANRNELCFCYPPTEKAAVSITQGDKYRVKVGEFLNDTLLEFGLRHVLSQVTDVRREETHVFNSFFYGKLSNKSKGNKPSPDGWPAYNSVQRWTRNKNVFDKRFIIVPINEHFHWYLAVIINPRGILRPRAQEPAPEISRPTTRATAGSMVGESPEHRYSELMEDPNVEARPEISANTQTHKNASPEKEKEDASGHQSTPGPPSAQPDQSLKQSLARSSSPSKTRKSPFFQSSPLTPAPEDGDGGFPHPGDQSVDPLDVMSQQTDTERDEDIEMKGVRSGVQEIDLDGPSSSKNEKEGSGDEETGGYIVTPTLLAMQQQNQVEKGGRLPVVTTVVDDDEEEEKAKAKDSASAKKGKARGQDANFEDGRTWIITFDSLGGAHRAVGTNLSRWLQYEAKNKLNIDYEPEDAQYWQGKVPQQGNFYDCGLFVVHYAKQLLQRPEEVLSFVQRRPPPEWSPQVGEWRADLDRFWQASETKNLRISWVSTMDDLANEWEKIEKERPKVADDVEGEGDASQVEEVTKEEREAEARMEKEVEQELKRRREEIDKGEGEKGTGERDGEGNETREESEATEEGMKKEQPPDENAEDSELPLHPDFDPSLDLQLDREFDHPENPTSTSVISQIEQIPASAHLERRSPDSSAVSDAYAEKGTSTVADADADVNTAMESQQDDAPKINWESPIPIRPAPGFFDRDRETEEMEQERAINGEVAMLIDDGDLVRSSSLPSQHLRTHISPSHGTHLRFEEEDESENGRSGDEESVWAKSLRQQKEEDEDEEELKTTVRPLPRTSRFFAPSNDSTSHITKPPFRSSAVKKPRHHAEKESSPIDDGPFAGLSESAPNANSRSRSGSIHEPASVSRKASDTTRDDGEDRGDEGRLEGQRKNTTSHVSSPKKLAPASTYAPTSARKAPKRVAGRNDVETRANKRTKGGSKGKGRPSTGASRDEAIELDSD